jgi:hypothetical protein
MKIYINSILFNLFFLTFCCTQIFSQEYVSDLKINQKGDEIQILYNLVGTYVINRKITSFNVSLYCSTDNGKTYHSITNASGQVGDHILSGKNKSIILKPDNPYNSLIGSYLYKIEAIPKETNLTFGLSYSRGFLFEDPKLNRGFNEIKLILFEPNTLHKGSTFIYVGFLNYLDSQSERWIWGTSIEKVTLLSAGFGLQTNNRSLAIYVGGGIGSWNVNDVGGQNHIKETAGSLTIGTIIKLIDTRRLTISFPLEAGAFIGPGDVYFSSGLNFHF